MAYKSGVYDGKITMADVTRSVECADERRRVNHAVLIVFFGFDAVSGPYWKIRNYWGVGWGENGHFRISRGKSTCGVAREVWCGVS